MNQSDNSDKIKKYRLYQPMDDENGRFAGFLSTQTRTIVCTRNDKGGYSPTKTQVDHCVAALRKELMAKIREYKKVGYKPIGGMI